MSPDNSLSAPPIRVMLVDDSAIVRGLISRALQQHKQIEIVATASDGEMAISVLEHHPCDVILLDIEMPKKDGLEALPQLKALAPDAHIIMVSSLTQRNAEISLKALSLGATDYLAKPTSHGSTQLLDSFYRELSDKVLLLGREAQMAQQNISAETADLPQEIVQPEPQTPPITGNELWQKMHPHALAIASSTGGPQALIKLFSSLPNDLLRSVPIFITQHMPPTFTTLLAEHINKDTSFTCREAADGELAQAGVIYLAPGDHHMCIKQQDGAAPMITLNQDPPVNFCRPAADPMFTSLAACYGAGLLAMVLTGMGQDGAEGARHVKHAGGVVLVQDKDSSVVWGMPGATVNAKAYDAIMSVEDMAETLTHMLGAAL